jgi:hypothetical protein
MHMDAKLKCVNFLTCMHPLCELTESVLPVHAVCVEVPPQVRPTHLLIQSQLLQEPGIWPGNRTHTYYSCSTPQDKNVFVSPLPTGP